MTLLLLVRHCSQWLINTVEIKKTFPISFCLVSVPFRNAVN